MRSKTGAGIAQLRFTITLMLATSSIGCAHAASSDSIRSGLSRSDLSIGVVYPSNNQSITFNPATLAGHFSPGFLDAALLISGFPPNFEASYVRNVGFAGFGGGFGFDSGIFKFNVGVGAGVGPFEFGVNARATSNYLFPPSIGIGIRVGDPHKVQGALYMDELINSNRNFTGGLAFTLGRAMKLELDLGPRFSWGFVFNSFVGSIGVLFFPTPDFSLHFRNDFMIIPSWNLSTRGPEIGLSYWFTKTFGMYGIFNDPRAIVVIGAKVNY